MPLPEINSQETTSSTFAASRNNNKDRAEDDSNNSVKISASSEGGVTQSVVLDHQQKHQITRSTITEIKQDGNKSAQKGIASAQLESDWHPVLLKDVDVMYEKLVKIGQGTYGEVFKARHRSTNKMVALKKVLMENDKEGFPITSLREIKILQLLKHENVVNLIEICTSKRIGEVKASFHMVFDFCEHDVAGLLANRNIRFTLPDIKKLLQQLLNGLYYLHCNKILHRDLKSANILLTKQGVLKLADFGLARAFSPGKSNQYTNRVVTLWYRPPELLLGERNYGPSIDIWGVGCIMAEMWTRVPILQGSSEQHQLVLISQFCGSITPSSMPGIENLDLYRKLVLPSGHKRMVKERLKGCINDHYALDLLDQLFILNPVKRIDADAALNHNFFWTDPLPTMDLSKTLLSQCSQSMFVFTTAEQRRKLMEQQVNPKRLCTGPYPPGGRLTNGKGGGRIPGCSDEQYRDRVF